MKTLFWISLSLLIADIVAFILVSIRINLVLKQGQVARNYRRSVRKARHQEAEEASPDSFGATESPIPAQAPAQAPAPAPRPQAPAAKPAAPAPSPYLTVGKAHNIGRRSYQQDSFGFSRVMNDQGLLAVVADGMGGLQGGEKVSQEIVMQCLNSGNRMRPDNLSNALSDMVSSANTAVNQMLGPDGLYKSGSTLVSVLVKDRQLMWISVGDSRIYLYRAGTMTQLSQDHDLLQEWMPDIRAGRMRYEDAVANPDARKLTSFIGMGNLRYIDRCGSPLQLQPGDRVLLMSDGVYGTITDNDMAGILASYPDVQQAAAAMEQRIEQVNLSYQDNYTVLIVAI